MSVPLEKGAILSHNPDMREREPRLLQKRHLKMQVFAQQMHCVVVEIGGSVETEFAKAQ
jgi:hypothetical protein